MAKTKKRKKNRNSAKVTALLVCLVLLTAGIVAIFVLDSGSKSGVREIEATTFGIDVARYQGTIDWAEAAENGVEFAMVRLGYRGYGAAGKLVKDDKALQNLAGARAAGLKVGVYFFSQALNIKEVDEEIDFMLDILGDFVPDMPIVLDWEYISAEARTANMDARTLTDCQVHFCEVMEEKGYYPMLYFNWHQSKNLLYLSELERWPFWLALYQDRMTYPYHVEMWQYTCTGKVPGIRGDVDINVYMPNMD
jgi:GH25 family lysozyme M1 (1,4-beta-N-acetylmuramidase)